MAIRVSFDEVEMLRFGVRNSRLEVVARSQLRSFHAREVARAQNFLEKTQNLREKALKNRICRDRLRSFHFRLRFGSFRQNRAFESFQRLFHELEILLERRHRFPTFAAQARPANAIIVLVSLQIRVDRFFLRDRVRQDDHVVRLELADDQKAVVDAISKVERGRK